MQKVMIFIDGTWLYHRIKEFSNRSKFNFDYENLPSIVISELKKQLNNTNAELDLVRVNYFGNYPISYDQDQDDISRQRKRFYSLLSEKYQYDVESYPRIIKSVADDDRSFDTKEKFVDIALATSMLFFAAIPNAYDIAIAILGDKDFLPALKRVRDLGKRVVIVSVHERCPAEFSEYNEEVKVKDFEIIWLDDLYEELNVEKNQNNREKETLANYSNETNEIQEGQILSGLIIEKKIDKEFAFISTPSFYKNFHFESKDVQRGDFDSLRDGDTVYFEVKDLSPIKIGKSPEAGNVRLESWSQISNRYDSPKIDFSELLEKTKLPKMLQDISQKFFGGKAQIEKTSEKISLIGYELITDKKIILEIKRVSVDKLEVDGIICQAEYSAVATELRNFLKKMNLIG